MPKKAKETIKNWGGRWSLLILIVLSVISEELSRVGTGNWQEDFGYQILFEVLFFALGVSCVISIIINLIKAKKTNKKPDLGVIVAIGLLLLAVFFAGPTILKQ